MNKCSVVETCPQKLHIAMVMSEIKCCGKCLYILAFCRFFLFFFKYTELSGNSKGNKTPRL